MRPREFFDFALELIASDGPYPSARCRSAVSRMYYAAFLDARDRLKQVPHVRLKPHTAHDQVLRALRFADDGKLKAIGNSLADLKKMREKADYDLDVDVMAGTINEAQGLSRRIQETLAGVDLSLCADPVTGQVPKV